MGMSIVIGEVALVPVRVYCLLAIVLAMLFANVKSTLVWLLTHIVYGS